MNQFRAALLGCALFLPMLPVHAQDSSPSSNDKEQAKDSGDGGSAPAAGQTPDDDFHNRENESKIVVTAAGLKTLDVLAGTSVLEGVALQRSMANQIGDVLVNQPGVSMSGFAPGASRPVLRGYSGSRVKMLIDGIDSIDASGVSADHAVAIDPFNAQRIDVLRGPAVLLYGSQAIGGAVNVIDKRIPLQLPDEPIHVDALFSGDTVANSGSASASADAPLGGGFAAHVDGSYHKSGDISVPGYTVAEPLRSEVLAQADAVAATDPALAAVLRGQANQQGTLPGSGTRTYSGTAGLAYFAGDSNVGASIGYYDSFYGVPVRPGGDESEPGNISLKQWRGDLRGELALGGGLFQSLKSHVAYTNYSHTELNSDGSTGTTFNVDGVEARSELVQANRSGWSGSMGVQFSTRLLDTVGPEHIVPRNREGHFALFALQEIPLGNFRMQLAGRFEHATVNAPDVQFDRSFDTVSGAIGLTYSLPVGIDIGFNANRVARAPNAEELLFDGYHDATQTYELGNPNLSTERAVGGEVFARGRIGGTDVSLTGFYNRFNGYIYESNTGQIRDGGPLYEYSQGDADYYGFEGEIDAPLYESDGGFELKSELRGSYVRAKLDNGGGDVPLIPPLTLFGALEGSTDAVTLRGEVAWHAKQNHFAANETPTAAYTLVNASVAWRPFRGDKNVTLLLKADNVFNVIGRLATSLTKDYTPLPGRNFEASLRLSF